MNATFILELSNALKSVSRLFKSSSENMSYPPQVCQPQDDREQEERRLPTPRGHGDEVQEGGRRARGPGRERSHQGGDHHTR